MTPPVLEVTASKAYGAIHALDEARLCFYQGEIAALVGENGAGKSTLCHVIGGDVRADRGELRVFGATYDATSYDVARALHHGVVVVAQHGNLIPGLSLVEHAMLMPPKPGAPRRYGARDRRRLAAELTEIAERAGLACDVDRPVYQLALGTRQRAEIALALWRGAKILILDEPTALLSPAQTAHLFDRLRDLAKTTTIAIVTHRLAEVAALADRVTVLRRGATVATLAGHAVADAAAITAAMVGEFQAASPPPSLPCSRAQAPTALGSARVPALQLAHLALGAWHDHLPGHSGFSLVLGRGEIVGIAGIDGNGQQELVEALAGITPLRAPAGLTMHAALSTTEGTTASATDLAPLTPVARRKAGLIVISADRHRDGVIEAWPLPSNALIGRPDLFASWRLPEGSAARAAERIADAMDVVPRGAPHVGALSGGNQQKFYMGRELAAPSIAALICSQPTRGVDVRAAATIWRAIYAWAEAGAGVAILSADLEELLAHCHRVVVLDRGRIVGEAATMQGLGELMTAAWEAHA